MGACARASCGLKRTCMRELLKAPRCGPVISSIRSSHADGTSAAVGEDVPGMRRGRDLSTHDVGAVRIRAGAGASGDTAGSRSSRGGGDETFAREGCHRAQQRRDGAEAFVTHDVLLQPQHALAGLTRWSGVQVHSAGIGGLRRQGGITPKAASSTPGHEAEDEVRAVAGHDHRAHGHVEVHRGLHSTHAEGARE